MGYPKMSKISALSMVFAAALAVAPAMPAFAQGQSLSPDQIQTMIKTGESVQAVQALKGVLAQHPNSGVAWYLMAEAQDARGHEEAAAQALARADQYAPGLPFANPQAADALRTHINRGLATSSAHHKSGGVSIVLLVIVALIALFVLLRIVAGWGRRSRITPPYQGYPNTPYGGGYGPNGPGPYGPGGGMGGGIGGGLGSSIVTGLAAGAGFAAGERIVDGLMGGNNAGAASPPAQQDFPAGPQDDGLIGDPGWGNDDDDNLNSDSW